MVSLLQTTEIKLQGVSFIPANGVYTTEHKINKITMGLNRDGNSFQVFTRSAGCVISSVFDVRAGFGARLLLQSYINIRTIRRALTASLDSCAEIRSVSSVAA